MAFHEVRFPDNISRGARGGPERRTQVVELASGDEERNASWANSRRRYDVAWVVNGVSRASAFLVSRDAEDRPVYGGTPADFAVVQAIQEMKARGLRVTFYPFILMDVPPGNTKSNPYSANAASAGQPTFPWRGRITCSPAAGFAGSVDKTTPAATQVAALFGTATPANFSVSGTNVSWTGPVGEWSLRRMILHYAHLCKAAGGVDAFLVGSEMPGLTTIRSGASTYPAVTAFKALAADVRAILGAGPKIGYAADWSEYFGHHPADGSSDVFFHLDPLWSDIPAQASCISTSGPPGLGANPFQFAPHLLCQKPRLPAKFWPIAAV